jgi:hypothetical protein
LSQVGSILSWAVTHPLRLWQRLRLGRRLRLARRAEPVVVLPWHVRQLLKPDALAVEENLARSTLDGFAM